jgi:hypothetical protein
MWAKPSKSQLAVIPKLYATEKIAAKDNKIYLHFFLCGCDWYITEYDGADTFFGFAILNNDIQNAEWGYISFDELKSVKAGEWLEVDTDKHWTVRPAGEVDKIVEAGGC